MGDRIEHIDYVNNNKVHIDTKIYIENQIMNPCIQLLAIALEYLPQYDANKGTNLTLPSIDKGQALRKLAKDKYKDNTNVQFLGKLCHT